MQSYEPNLRTLRACALEATTSRSFAGAVVTRACSKFEDARATSSTARLNTFSFAEDGFANPLIFLTNCRAAARISSSVAGGSKLYRVLMFLHTLLTSRHRLHTAAAFLVDNGCLSCVLVSRRMLCVGIELPQIQIRTYSEKFSLRRRRNVQPTDREVFLSRPARRRLPRGIFSRRRCLRHAGLDPASRSHCLS